MALVAILAATAGLGLWQNRERAAGRVDPVSGTLRTAVLAASGTVDSGLAQARSIATAIGGASRRDAEVASLRRQEASWRGYAERVDRLEREVARLQRMVRTPAFGRDRLAARILDHHPLQNRFTISAGTAQGLRPGLAVVGPEGLLGTVQTVEQGRAQVLAITSPALKIGAYIDGKPKLAGLVSGQTPQRLVMDVLDLAEVKPGQGVFTAGYSEHIPRGIGIGFVAEFVLDPSYGTRRVYIVPSADISESVDVWVLK